MKIRRLVRQILFFFARPRYRKGDRVLLWGALFELEPPIRDWTHCYYLYQIDEHFKVSEGVIDFYNNH